MYVVSLCTLRLFISFANVSQLQLRAWQEWCDVNDNEYDVTREAAVRFNSSCPFSVVKSGRSAGSRPRDVSTCCATARVMFIATSAWRLTIGVRNHKFASHVIYKRVQHGHQQEFLEGAFSSYMYIHVWVLAFANCECSCKRHCLLFAALQLVILQRHLTERSAHLLEVGAREVTSVASATDTHQSS